MVISRTRLRRVEHLGRPRATADADVAVGRVEQGPAHDEPAHRGLRSACPHDARSAAGSGPGTPPSTTQGSVVAPKTVSESSHDGIFSQV